MSTPQKYEHAIKSDTPEVTFGDKTFQEGAYYEYIEKGQPLRYVKIGKLRKSYKEKSQAQGSPLTKGSVIYNDDGTVFKESSDIRLGRRIGKRVDSKYASVKPSVLDFAQFDDVEGSNDVEGGESGVDVEGSGVDVDYDVGSDVGGADFDDVDGGLEAVHSYVVINPGDEDYGLIAENVKQVLGNEAMRKLAMAFIEKLSLED